MSATKPTVDSPSNRDYPLSGITVIDLSHVYNGPYATFLMALAGATVIKVEPFVGEHLRSRGDMGGAALPFAMLNSNKKAVTLNLKSEKGRELLREMAARADILVENFAPGVMDRLGVGAADLHKINPRLIYGSSSGYGKDGPYRDYPAMDLVMQAMCGVINFDGLSRSAAGEVGRGHLRFHGRHHLYAAIMTALYERERTGQGPRRRSLDAGCDLLLARLESRDAARTRRGRSGAHRQPARRPRASRRTTSISPTTAMSCSTRRATIISARSSTSWAVPSSRTIRASSTARRASRTSRMSTR
jgi:crotonobetainyl-CoA:carnitine CoA-transferase CaiB-like acyl-CoA transferase